MTIRTILRAAIISGALAPTLAASAQAEDTIYISFVCVWSADQVYNIPIPVTHDGKSERYNRIDIDTHKKTVTVFLGATLETIDVDIPYVHQLGEYKWSVSPTINVPMMTGSVPMGGFLMDASWVGSTGATITLHYGGELGYSTSSYANGVRLYECGIRRGPRLYDD